jgi:hypothetical protein
MARKLGQSGIERFKTFIRSNRREPGSENLPSYLLSDQEFSSPLAVAIEIGEGPFKSRYDMAEHLVNAFRDIDIQPLIADSGFWSWIALAWFDQLCPRIRGGGYKPSEYYNYVLSPDYRHRPRHALRTSWELVLGHGENARFVLSGDPRSRGEIAEQLAARQKLMAYTGVIAGASELYWDPDRMTFKKGVTARDKGGTITRLINFLDQIDLTYDLYSLKSEELLELLPPEFERFGSGPAS